jgi:hypothetical protein
MINDKGPSDTDDALFKVNGIKSNKAVFLE